MSKKKNFDQPFNRRIPPLFLPGGLLDKVKEIGPRVRFMVEMPEGHSTLRQWLNVYESARRELAEIVFLEERCATYAELSQLDWLKQAGHRLWMKDERRPLCNLNAYVRDIERRLKVAEHYLTPEELESLDRVVGIAK